MAIKSKDDRKTGCGLPPPAYRPFAQQAQLKPAVRTAGAPPVYRPVPQAQTAQMKPGNVRDAFVRPMAPPVYRPVAPITQLKPSAAPPVYRPGALSPGPAGGEAARRLAAMFLGGMGLGGTVQRASASSTEVKKPLNFASALSGTKVPAKVETKTVVVEPAFEAVGAKASAKKAAKGNKDQELAETILADATAQWLDWLDEPTARNLNCGDYIVNRAVCRAVEALGPGGSFHVKPMRESDGKAAVNLQALAGGYLFNYHVYWSKTA